ncbi:MAG: hypothetical protein JSR99_12070 [Proteobacteria bacterium]|nr:hypothetical protein [Pseudomonadota bacterium]
MTGSDFPHRDSRPVPPPDTGNSGAVILVLLAIAAFGGWYVIVRERPSDATPLPIVQKPIIPPATMDTSAKFPGERHSAVLGDAEPIKTSNPGSKH